MGFTGIMQRIGAVRIGSIGVVLGIIGLIVGFIWCAILVVVAAYLLLDKGQFTVTWTEVLVFASAYALVRLMGLRVSQEDTETQPMSSEGQAK